MIAENLMTAHEERLRRHILTSLRHEMPLGVPKTKARPWPNGLGAHWGNKKCIEKNILFTQLWAVQERSSNLKHAEQQHCCLGSIVEDTGGAC